MNAIINLNPPLLQTTQMRASALTNTLLKVIETVVRAVVAAFAIIAFLASMGQFLHAKQFGCQQWGKALTASDVAAKCFRAIIYPIRTLDLSAALFEPHDLNAQVRETRVRVGTEEIQRKLEKEWTLAQEQMNQEVDGAFHYTKGQVGHAKTEHIGDVEVGVCHFIGRRSEMEDEHLATEFHVFINGQVYSGKLFGVFDGHGGNAASQFLKNQLKAKLEEKIEQFNPLGLSDEGIWNALKLTFVDLNREFDQTSGSTATIVMIFDGKLWTGNVGDSRTILQNGEEILQLSQDANPEDPRFAKGIQNRGGQVTIDSFGLHRVNGSLAVARSLGDHTIGQGISARPKITCMPLNHVQPNSRLVLCCDGIYDVASTRQIGNAVRNHNGIACEKMAQNIVFSAFRALSYDNLSAMVVNLNTVAARI